MFCTACGTKNSQESNFCKQCGQRIEKPTHRISEEEFNRTLPENDQVGALMERAYDLRLKGDLAGAAALCEQALKLSPDSASAHSLLGQIYEQQGDKTKAIQEFETVLAHNPASIADRVKLDQLRDGEPKSAKAPQVVVTHPLENRPPNIFAMIGVGAALILVGAVAANQMRPATPSAADANRQTTQNSSQSNNSAANPISANGNTAPILPNATAPSNLPSTAGTVAQTTPNILSSPFGTLPIVINSSAPSPNPIRTRQSYPVVNTSTTGGTMPVDTAHVNPPTNLTQKDTKADIGNAGASRTRLADEDGGVVQGENGNYKIVVDMSGGTRTKTPPETRPAPVNTNRMAGSKDPSSIKIKMANNSNSNGETSNVSNANFPSSDARTAISIGKDLKLRGDYARAIASFRKALANAGDDTGYVYQEIGKCYQDKGDKDSAIVNYEKAISEFQKLLEAGRGVENARVALRTCQNGIKVCKSD